MAWGVSFTKGKNTFILFHKYNGWAFLCEYIADISVACCPNPKHTSRVANFTVEMKFGLLTGHLIGPKPHRKHVVYSQQ